MGFLHASLAAVRALCQPFSCTDALRINLTGGVEGLLNWWAAEGDFALRSPCSRPWP